MTSRSDRYTLDSRPAEGVEYVRRPNRSVVYRLRFGDPWSPRIVYALNHPDGDYREHLRSFAGAAREVMSEAKP